MVFASCFKVYSQYSGRRFSTDMRIANEKGHVSKVPHFNSIFNYLGKEEMTPILLELIKVSSLPLATVETDFAADSSGFSTSEFKRWYDFKYGRDTTERLWLKAHVNTGVKTNIVTAVKITEAYKSDSKQFEELVHKTSENFKIVEQSADKAYSSRANLELVNSLGGTAYIPFKSNTTGNARGSKLWTRMYHYFEFRKEEFLDHYHNEAM